MLGTIIKNQVLENIYGIKFVVIFFVCAVVMIGTAITGIGRYATHQKDEQHIVSTNRKTLAEASDWRDVSREGIKLVKPANKLGIMAAGLEDAVGRTATVRVDDYPVLEDSIYSTAPIFAIFGELDLTFIMRTVISLFVILFTFDLISGEKEKGTLKQCLANPVPRNTFMLGKSIGSFISLLIPIVLPLIISLLIIMVLGGVSFTGEEWISVLVIIGGYLLYVLAFFSVGVFVSTLVKNSSVSFLILLFFWVLVVLIIPKGSMMIANQINPIPSINDVRASQFSLRENFYAELWRKVAEESERQNLDGLTDRRERFMAFRKLRSEIWAEMEPEFEEQKKKINEDFKRDQGYLTDLAVNLSRVSPASAVTYISMNMAGTGYQEQENFLRQLTLYRTQFGQHVDKMMEQENQVMGPGRRMSAAEEQGALEINSIPNFYYSDLTAGERLSMVLPDFATLAIIAIIFYLLAFINFIRYDVR
jgi:ABC-type transport system involved in multi-copper enzyme maturation permease subunit